MIENVRAQAIHGVVPQDLAGILDDLLGKRAVQRRDRRGTGCGKILGMIALRLEIPPDANVPKHRNAARVAFLDHATEEVKIVLGQKRVRLADFGLQVGCVAALGNRQQQRAVEVDVPTPLGIRRRVGLTEELAEACRLEGPTRGEVRAGCGIVLETDLPKTIGRSLGPVAGHLHRREQRLGLARRPREGLADGEVGRRHRQFQPRGSFGGRTCRNPGRRLLRRPSPAAEAAQPTARQNRQRQGVNDRLHAFPGCLATAKPPA